MRKTKLSFDLFAQQHGNDGLFARFYRRLPARSLSRGHSFEVSKYDGKNEVYPDLIQGQKIKAKTVPHPPAKAGLKGVHRQDCRRQPPTIIALSRQDSYAHTLKGYFYTNLGGSPRSRFIRLSHPAGLLGKQADNSFLNLRKLF